MYIVVADKHNRRTKFLIDNLLVDIIPNSLFKYEILDSSEYHGAEYKVNRPVIYLGKDVFTKLTGDTETQLGESLWSVNPSVRHIPNYSLEQLHDNANLFHSFWRFIHIPYLYPVNEPPDLDNIQTIYDIPSKEDFKSDIVAFDIESGGFNPFYTDLLLIAISDGYKSWIVRPEQFSDIRLSNLFLDPAIKWLAHNGKFDVRWLVTKLDIRPILAHDSMLLHYITDERKGTHGLKDLINYRLAVPDYESELKGYLPRKDASYAVVPKPILEKYAAIDALYTKLIFNQLMQEVKDHHHSEGLLRAYRFVMDAQEMYTDVELNGIYVDIEQVNKKEQELNELLTISYNKVVNGSSIPNFNPNSPQQVAKYVYDIKKYKNPKTSKNIKPRTTDSATIIGLLEQHPDDELLQNLIACRNIKKLLSTYVLPTRKKLDPDGRVRPNFNVHGTATGRPSCERPNLQNIPRQKSNKYTDGIRRMFKAKPGYTLVQLDFKSAELRVAGILSEDTNLKKLFESGVDLHTGTAIDMFKIPTPTDEERTTAKTMNFKLLFGGTSYSVAMTMGITRSYAQKLIDLWWRPKVKLTAWFKRIKNKCEQSLEIVMRSGRIRRLPFRTDSNHVQNIIKNTEIQSLASDACVQSGVWINQWLKRRSMGKLVLTVHDNLVIECKIEDAEKVAATGKHIMSRAGRKVMQTDFIQLIADDFVGEYLK